METPLPRRGGEGRVEGASSPSAQLEALNLAGRCLGQRGDELDPARVLVGRELVLHEALELLLERRRGDVAVLEDDEGLGLDEAARVLVPDNGGFEHRRVADER